MANAQPWPEELRLSEEKQTLYVRFDDGALAILPAELLRVESPSAEVQGHHAEEKQLVRNKAQVKILDMQPVGSYAVRLIFDDGHDTGLFSWQLLYEYGQKTDEMMANYRAQIAKSGG